MNNRVELRMCAGKGEGIFATTQFIVGDIVMIGDIDRFVERNNSHASQIGESQFVLFSGVVNQVNHSCDPNCIVEVSETGKHEFVAKRDIQANEEITFDYSLSNYTIDYFPKRCMCGSSKCRGTITGWKDLPLSEKKELENFAASYLLKLDAKNSRRANG